MWFLLQRLALEPEQRLLCRKGAGQAAEVFYAKPLDSNGSQTISSPERLPGGCSVRLLSLLQMPA